MIPTYLIPGLGADERIFQRLQLRGPVRCIDWLEPLSADEPLGDYAARMAAPIPPDEDCLIVGVSFGGIVALEMGCRRPRAQVVLVSSMAEPAARPPLLRLGALVRADAWLPIGWMRHMQGVGRWFFGIGGGERSAELFAQLLTKLPVRYTRWALKNLFTWPGCPLRPVAQLAGDRDRVFPDAWRRATHVIRGGTHFMIVTHAAQISTILNELAGSRG